MYLVALGFIGLGDWILETESGRPLATSLVLSRRDSLRLEEEVCLDEEWDLDEDLEDEDDLEDFSVGTSRMFKTRPVVGSVVEAWEGSWETW
jgi:hypothetical protein